MVITGNPNCSACGITTEMKLLLSEQSVADMLDCSKTQVRNLVKKGIIPPPIKLGEGYRAMSRWKTSDIQAAVERVSA